MPFGNQRGHEFPHQQLLTALRLIGLATGLNHHSLSQVLLDGDSLDPSWIKAVERGGGEPGGTLKRPQAKNDHRADLSLTGLRSVGGVVVDVLELANVSRDSGAGIKKVKLAIFAAVVTYGPISLDHALISTLSLAGVVEEAVLALAVVDIAVEDTLRLVGKEEDIWRLA